MSKPLTTTQREKMFQAWVKSQHIKNVSTTCGISEQACRKYRKADDWDNRLNKISAKAKVKLDDSEAKYTADQLKVIRNVKNVYLTCLIGKTPCPHCEKPVPVPKLKPNFKDITEIIRTEELLRGKPDSRPDLGRMYDELSDEQLDELCQETMDEICDRLRSMSRMRRMKDIKKAIKGMLDELG